MFSQPTRLNVFKNDQETWDYTNPNLGGPGKTLIKLSHLSDLPFSVLSVSCLFFHFMTPTEFS